MASGLELMVLTEEKLEGYRQGMFIIGIITLVSNAIGVAFILKCPFSVIGSYKWHLLNIAICGCLMDLHFSFVFAGFPLLPILGFCSTGWSSAFPRIIAEDVTYLIYVQLFGLYGLALANAILYHMTKIVGAKSFLKSKRALTVSLAMQIFFAFPCWIFHIFLIPTENEIGAYVSVKAPLAADFITQHKCSLVVVSTAFYIYFSVCALTMFICSVGVFVCCLFSVLLLLRNKSGKTSREYSMFKLMTIGLINQMVWPMLILICPLFYASIRIMNDAGDPTRYTPLAFQIMSLHSTVNVVAMVIFTGPIRQGFKIFPQQTEPAINELFERRHPIAPRPQSTTAVVAFSEQAL